MTHEKKSRFTYANVTSTLALIIAVGGGGAAVAAVAANSVGSAAIIDGAVKNAEVANNAIRGAEVADGALTGDDVKNGRLTGDDLKSGSVPATDLATSNVGVARGYAYMGTASPTIGVATALGSTYRYNRSGGAVNVTRTATGAYTVSFVGMAVSGGNVQITAYGPDYSTCKVVSWSGSSVSVECYDAAGALLDSRFSIAVLD